MSVTKHSTPLRVFIASRKEASTLKYELAGLASCKYWQVTLKNFQQFKSGHRYLYFTAGKTFGKLTNDPETKVQLARESISTQTAHALGLPSVKVLVPYCELANGQACMLVERLTLSRRSLIREFRDTALIGPASSQQYAALAANAIFQSSFRPILTDLATSQLLRNEEQAWVVRSPSSLFQKIELLISHYEITPVQISLAKAFPGVDFDYLLQLFRQLPVAISELTANWGEMEDEYFAHNDTTVKNIYYGAGKRQGSAFFFDYEVASATHFPILSLLQDLTQFYSSASFNISLQQHFAQKSLEVQYAHVPIQQDKDRRLIMRTAMLLGTLNLGHYILKRAWEQHENYSLDIAESIEQDFDYSLIVHLFNNCVTNLAFLEPHFKLSPQAEQAILTDSVSVTA